MFIEKLNALLKEKNITRAKLSEDLKFGKNQIKYWETHGNIPNGAILQKLADYFNVSADYFLSNEENQSAISVTDDDLKVALMFKDNFERALKNSQKTLYALSKETGISPGQLHDYKSGRRIPKIQTCEKIAKSLNVTVDYLLGRSEEKQAAKDVTEDDIKVALFGGDSDVTDEMWEEVKSFAQFVKNKGKKK